VFFGGPGNSKGVFYPTGVKDISILFLFQFTYFVVDIFEILLFLLQLHIVLTRAKL
jgi:hypothetical protein